MLKSKPAILSHNLQNKCSQDRPKRISCLHTLHGMQWGIGYAFMSICQQWQGDELESRIIVPSCVPAYRRPGMIEAIPSWLKPLAYRNTRTPRLLAQWRFLQDLQEFDAVHLWPDASLSTFREVKKQGKPIFLERVNSHVGNAKRILDHECQRLGLSPDHNLTEEHIHQELQELNFADYIFSPSPCATESYLAAGVPGAKIIPTSYGWAPERFMGCPIYQPQAGPIRVLFLASVCVRKGAHLLLQMWDKAGIDGHLTILGGMTDAIATTQQDLLNRPNVTHIGFQEDYTIAYQEADLFVLPSLEEGSPLVIYEAMAHGLPILTSPMGAGGVVRDGIDGIVLPPHEQDAWIEALRKLATDPDLRLRLGTSGREWVQSFTWKQMAQRRATAILERL